MVNKKVKLFFLVIITLLVMVLSSSVVFSFPVGWTIPGYIFGPSNLNASVNITIYDNATGFYINDTLVNSNEVSGYYIYTFTLDTVDYNSIDIDIYAYKDGASGRNNSFTNMNVGDGTPEGEWMINVTMSHPLILTSPINNSYLNYNYTNLTWEYTNFTEQFKLQIDDEESFSSPYNLSVDNLPGNSTGNFSNYSMSKDESLSDGTYYWRVVAYNDSLGLTYDISDVFTFVIDKVAPIITLYNPLNNSWTNDPTPDLTLTTNEDASCLGDNYSLSYYSKSDDFDGDGTTVHTFNLDLYQMYGEGENTYYVQCNDTAGNIGVEEVYTINLDTIAPNSTSNYTSLDGVWVNSSQTISIIEDDPEPSSGINWTKYCLTNGCNPSSGTTYSGPVIIDTEGSSYFRFATIDNVTNLQTTQEVNVKIDTEAPNTTSSFSYDNTWINFDAEVTLSPEDPNESIGDGSGVAWTKYCYSSETTTCTPDTSYAGTVTINDENITYFRYHSEDNVGNQQEIQTIVVKVDKTEPDNSLAGVEIDGGAVYSNDFTLDFTWDGFDDNITGRNVSGINGYYYSLTNNEGTTSGTFDTSSPGTLVTGSEGNNTVYIWAADSVAVTGPNLGLSVNDSIFVDTIAPQYLWINQTNITEDSGSDNFVFTINITETGSGHEFVPKYRYRYNQSTDYSDWFSLTENGGDEYQLVVGVPSWGWNMNRFQNLSIQINATDLTGNENISEEFLELVDSINDAPILDFIDNQTISQGSLLSFNITGYDLDNDSLESVTLVFGTNETNLTTLQINNTLFQVNWTPENEYVGENYVNFSISDGELIDSQIVLINVSDVNDPPVFDLIPNMTAYENITFSQDINATDPELQSLIYGENTSLFEIDENDGTFSFTPVNNDVGNHSILFNVSDGNGGVDEQVITLEVIDVFSEINFTLRDRIFNNLLWNATLTGGDSCSSGCEFNNSIFRFQTNGDIEFNLTAVGYSLNSTTYSITENENFTVLLDDIANPLISAGSIDYFINGSDGFYLNISVNASDNLGVENVSFNYSIDAHNESIIDTSGLVNMTWQEADEYNVILGPYAYSFDLTSNQIAQDYYGNINASINDLRIYIYVTNATGAPAVNTAPVLAAIGNLTATVEKEFSETIVAADAEGNVLTYGENSTLFVIDSSLGNFTFTPNSSQVGNYTILFNVTDGALSDQEIINLEIITSVCGDDFCSSSESCSSCSTDCGTCPASSSSSSSSGGGGGGGSRTVTVTEYVNQTIIEEVEVIQEIIVNETCVNNFTCSGWEPSVCNIDGELQQRTCYDQNNCTDFIYIENQSCILEQVYLEVQEEKVSFFNFFPPFFKNIAGNAWQFESGGAGPALFTILGLLLIGLLVPVVLWKVNSKTYVYEISDLHAIVDGHNVHIRSYVSSNKQGSKGKIVEQWAADVDNYVYEETLGKV